LNTPANIKQFMKDKKDEAAQLRVEGAKLQAELYKLKVQFDSAVALEGLKGKNAMALQKEITQRALELENIRNFGSVNVSPFAVGTAIKQGQKSVVYVTQDKPNTPQILTQQEAIKFGEAYAETGGDMEESLKRAGIKNGHFAGFTKPVPQGQQNAITIDRIGNPTAGGGLGGNLPPGYTVLVDE
jgi:hypothetical protein